MICSKNFKLKISLNHDEIDVYALDINKIINLIFQNKVDYFADVYKLHLYHAIAEPDQSGL